MSRVRPTRTAAALGTMLAGVLALASCGSPPPVRHPEMPVDLPPTWAGASSPGGPGDASAAFPPPGPPVAWWGSFEDDRLEELVGEALGHNWDLVAASARVDAAAAQARIVGAEIFPEIGASGRGARAQQVFIGLPIPGAPGDEPLKTTSNSFGVSLDVSWELDLWGRLRNQRSAAGADFQAAAADLHGARLSLASQTLKGWFAALATRRQMELADSTAQSFQRTVDGIRERYEQGVRTSLDLRLAMVDQANAERALEGFRLAYESSVRQLEILLGRYPEGKLEVDGNLAPPPGPVPAGLPSELIARRPDIAAAERRVAAANRRVAESRANLLPRISLTGSGGRSTGELGDLADGDFEVWSLVGNIFQPIFQGGRLRAQVQASRSREEEALAQYVGTVLRACGEVETALLAERILAEEERAARVAAEQAAGAHELAIYRYRNGLVDIITLLAAQRSAALAESALIDVRRRRLEARVDLHLALGGSFDGTPPPDAAAATSAEAPGAQEDRS